VIFELRLTVVGKIGLPLGVVSLEPGEEGLGLGHSLRPTSIIGQWTVQIVVGEEILVTVRRGYRHLELE